MDAPREKAVESYTRIRPKYEAYALTVASLLRQLCAEYDIRFEAIEHRAKDPESLADKLERHPNYQKLSDVTDLCGLRVVVFYSSDIQRVLDMISKEFSVGPPEEKGANVPQLFGYRGVHILTR